jgi:hypothetical protein
MKNRAQRAQRQIRARAGPTGTTCLIWKDRHLEHVLKRFSARSFSPWSAKTSQMDASSPATPKYKISRPKIPPNVRNSERNHPPATSGIVVIYLLVPPTPAQHPPPYYTPPPSHPAPSAYQPPYPLTQKTLFVILTSPGSPAYTLVYSVFWVVGLVPYTLIMYVGLNPSLKA